MCFSQTSSLAFSIFGLFLAYVAHSKYKNPELVKGILFFFAMEFLQYLQFFTIGQCDNFLNKFLTIAGFAHICLQPYFTHVLSSSMAVNPRVIERYKTVKVLSLMAGAFFFGRWVFSSFQVREPSTECPSYEWLRGKEVCTFMGQRHLAWSIPMMDPTYYSPSGAIHLFMMFAPFFLSTSYKMWIQGVFLFMTGPFLASFVTPNLQEQASIWCFFSIAQIAIMVWVLSLSLGMAPKNDKGKGKKHA